MGAKIQVVISEEKITGADGKPKLQISHLTTPRYGKPQTEDRKLLYFYAKITLLQLYSFRLNSH